MPDASRSGYRQPPLYTNRRFCPITGCGWFHDEHVRPDGPWAPWQGSIEATVFATHMAQVQAVDRTIANHLATHPMLEWFREVRNLQNRLAEATTLLGYFVDHEDQPCRLNHHGACKAHNGSELRPCDVAAGRELLGRIRGGGRDA